MVALPLNYFGIGGEMKIFSKLSNVHSVFGISIRPGQNNFGAKKLKAIKKNPRILKYFESGKLVEMKDEPKTKSKKPTPAKKSPKSTPSTSGDAQQQ